MLYAITNNAGEWYFYTTFPQGIIKWSTLHALTYTQFEEAKQQQEEIKAQGTPCRVVPFKQADV